MEERKKINKEKAEFYFKNKLKSHISLTTKGVKNGYFDSDLIDEDYYWFIDDKEGRIRLFFSEIYELKDFKILEGSQ